MSNTTFGTGTAAGIALAVVLAAGSAGAQDASASIFQRATGKVSQDLTLRDNFNFNGSGFSWNTTSRLAITLRAENSQSQFSANTGTGFRLNSSGSGSVIEPALGLRFATSTRHINVNAAANYSKSDVTYDELQPDLSLLTFPGERESVRLSFGASGALNRANSVSVSATYGTVSFTPATTALVDNDTYGLSATLNHDMNQSTRLSLTGGLSFFQPAGGFDAVTTSISGGLNRALDRSTTLNANVGLALTETERSAGGTRSDSNFTYGLGLSHQLPSGQVSASLSQQVVPTASGALKVNTGLRAGYSERINQRERIGVSAAYDIQNGLSGSGSTTFFTVTPNYSVQLGPDVAASAAYSLQRNDTGNFAQSLNFSLSKDFNLPF